MSPPSAWNKLVSQMYKNGKKTKKTYSLKEAMRSASKVWKSGKKTLTLKGGSKCKGGDPETVGDKTVPPADDKTVPPADDKTVPSANNKTVHPATADTSGTGTIGGRKRRGKSSKSSK